MGKKVVDFASGSGIQAIAAVQSGAVEVLAVDIDGYAVAATAINAIDNGVEAQITASAENIIGKKIDADVLLAGDVCYEEPLATEVFHWLRATAANGTTVLLGDPGRWALPPGVKASASSATAGADSDEVARVVEVANLELPRSLQDENHGFQRAFVWRVEG